MKEKIMPMLGPANEPSFLPKADPVSEYCVDAYQRAILYLDVLRQRGNNFFEQEGRTAPNVLSFDAELPDAQQAGEHRLSNTREQKWGGIDLDQCKAIHAAIAIKRRKPVGT
jgi:Protein of unknown function (DUF3141)